MSDLPVATLFMLMSADGKISTGSTDERDFDKDLPKIPSIAEGLNQYYELEEKTDQFSLNTGKVMAKVGWNESKDDIDRIPVTFVIIDNKPHLTELGVSNLLRRTQKVYLVTTNPQHPAQSMQNPNLEIINYEERTDFRDLFKKLKSKGADKITVQSGGEMNAQLMRQGLINFASIVVAPVIVGGKDTPTLVDSESLETVEDLARLRPLELISADKLNNSYLHLQYKLTV
jgi:2,5-diamino-6-(ribosylamino)-4(3H)-pyrimidinone 5'-phosphate reductase